MRLKDLCRIRKVSDDGWLLNACRKRKIAIKHYNGEIEYFNLTFNSSLVLPALDIAIRQGRLFYVAEPYRGKKQ